MPRAPFRRRTSLVVLSLAVMMAPACTLFSGWSDLQNGEADATTSREDVSSTPRDSTVGSPEASPRDGAPDPPSEIDCGGVRCSNDAPCCVSATGRACSSSCDTRSLVLAECASNRDCAAVAGRPFCCVHNLSNVTSCVASCGSPTDLMLCDPTGTDCPTDDIFHRACRTEARYAGLFVCE